MKLSKDSEKKKLIKLISTLTSDMSKTLKREMVLRLMMPYSSETSWMTSLVTYQREAGQSRRA